MLHRLFSFFGRHAMPVVALLAALATCVAVPPDAGYASYIDWATLAKLAAMLMAVGGLGASGAVQVAAVWAVRRCSGVRALVAALVGVTALASMFVTNDMALLAMLPLSAACLATCGRLDLMAPAFVLQGLAANLCGMLLPFGNPQNIYLSGFFGVGLGEFVGVMLAPFALSTLFVALACLSVGGGPAKVEAVPVELRPRQAGLSVTALACCVACVVGALPAWACLAAVALLTVAGDPRLPLRMDWGLVVTFTAFFVFSGNLARVPAVQQAFSSWLAAGAFVPAALLSQLISNVPAAIVLSGFTGDWAGLVRGVNVGGAGTPVASLATLIVIAQYGAAARGLSLPVSGRASQAAAGVSGRPTPKPVPTRRFLGLLVGANLVFLAILLAAGLALGW